MRPLRARFQLIVAQIRLCRAVPAALLVSVLNVLLCLTNWSTSWLQVMGSSWRWLLRWLLLQKLQNLALHPCHRMCFMWRAVFTWRLWRPW